MTASTRTTSTTLAYYSSSSTGGAIRFGFPIGETESIGIGLGLDSTSIKTYEQTPQYYRDYVSRFGETNLSVPLTLRWASDGKDSFFFPTKGTFQRASLEVALPGGDLTYYRASYQLQHFVPLNSRFTLMVNGEYGITDLYVGVPAIIGAGGVEKIVEIALDADEKKMFNNSVDAVRELVEAVKNLDTTNKTGTAS